MIYDLKVGERKETTSKEVSWQKRLTFLIILFFILIRIFSVVSPGTYNIHDDYQGYFVFSEKMIQTGSIGTDPYSERRIVSSLGGQYYLGTFIYNFGDIKNISFVDYGVGYIIFLISLLYLFKEYQLGWIYSALIFFGATISVPPISNITGFYIAATLFIAICRIGSWKTEKDKFDLGFFGSVILLTSSLCSLKSSLIPASIILFGFFCLFANGAKITLKNKITVFLCGIAAIFLLLTPWMMSMLHSSGTLLYPLLGKGFHGSSYGTFMVPTHSFGIKTFISLIYDWQNILFLIIFLIFVIRVVGKKLKGERFEDYFVMSGILGVLIISISTAGYATYRYTYAFILPITIVLLLFEIKEALQSKHILKGQIAFLILGIFIGGNIYDFFIVDKAVILSIKFGLKNQDIVSNVERDEYKAMQMSVPKGETILVRLEKNFVLDFNRNQIFIADYPGASSPPPGMPYKQGSEKLAEYLISKDIRYVAYAYKTSANFSKENFSDRLIHGINAWIKTEAENAFDFQDNIFLLGLSRKRIFDDGKIFVLDLATTIKN
ncbi:hypothetical protein FJ364_01590 [Candidatus Dependentiae bacterium]|nr:hypothetical protein [Candidatus Dependentiae bacterium]